MISSKLCITRYFKTSSVKKPLTKLKAIGLKSCGFFCLQSNFVNCQQPISRVLSKHKCALGDHSSRMVVTYHLVQPTRAKNGAQTHRAKSLLPLFGLAPDGVYLAKHVAMLTVRSYRTFSPLPNLSLTA